MTSQPLQNSLSKLTQSAQPNNIYIAFDDSSSVTPDEYSMIKIFLKMFLSLIFSLKANFFRTSIIKYDDVAVDVALAQVAFAAVETIINNLVQKKGAVNFLNGMAKIEELSAQAQGNKVLFLFNNGTAIDKNKILDLSAKGFEIFCFLVLANGQAKKNELDATFGNDKVILLPDLKTAQTFFGNLVITSGDVPNIAVKSLGSSTATLTISGIDGYKDAKFTIKNIKNGLPVQSPDQTLKNAKEIVLNLAPENPKYKINVQGIKGNLISQVSNEIEFTLSNKIHHITEKIQTPDFAQKLRESILKVQVSDCLKSVDIPTYNIGFIGDCGNGKSSLINLLFTALAPKNQDKIKLPAITGQDDKSITPGKEKFSLTRSINIYDSAGLQPGDNSNAEVDYFAQGRLLDNFQQGGALNEDNKRFRREANLKGAPHVFIYVVDSITATNDDSIKRFGDLIRILRKHRVQILVALTKLDLLQENGSPVLNESDFGQVLENGVVKKFIQEFSTKAKIPVHDIFPVFNYTGASEKRSQVKDTLALILLDQALHSINTYFERYTVVQIVDQNERNQGSFLLKNQDMLLEEFYSDFRAKISHDRFTMKGFYQNDTLISEAKWKTMVLNDIKVDRETDDGFQTWFLKLQNDIAAPPTAQG